MISEDIEAMREELAGLPERLLRALGDLNRRDEEIGAYLEDAMGNATADLAADLWGWWEGTPREADEEAVTFLPQSDLPRSETEAFAAPPLPEPSAPLATWVFPEAIPVDELAEHPDHVDPRTVFADRPELPSVEGPSPLFERPEIPEQIEEETADAGWAAQPWPDAKKGETGLAEFELPDVDAEIERDELPRTEGESGIIAVLERVAEAVEELVEMGRRADKSEAPETAGWQRAYTPERTPEMGWGELFGKHHEPAEAS